MPLKTQVRTQLLGRLFCERERKRERERDKETEREREAERPRRTHGLAILGQLAMPRQLSMSRQFWEGCWRCQSSWRCHGDWRCHVSWQCHGSCAAGDVAAAGGVTAAGDVSRRQMCMHSAGTHYVHWARPETKDLSVRHKVLNLLVQAFCAIARTKMQDDSGSPGLQLLWYMLKCTI